MRLSRAYVILVVCWSTWFWSSSVQNTITALFPAIQQSLTLSAASITLLISANSLGSLTSYLLSGFICGRFGPRRVIIIGILVSLFCLVAISLSTDYLYVLITRSFLGFSIGLYLPAGISILSDVFPPEKRGRFIGIHEMAAPAGSTLGPVITSVFLTWGLNWNGTLQVWVIPTIIVLALQLVFVRGLGQREEKNVSSKKDDPSNSVVEKSGVVGTSKVGSSPWFTKNLLLIVLAMILRNVASMGMTLMPVFWVADYGVAVSTAAFVFGIVRVFAIFGQAGAGYLSDIFGRTRVMLMLQIAASIMWLPSFYLPFGPYLFISLSIVSIFTNGFMPVVFTYMSDRSRSTAERARMVGIVMASSGVGGVINPPIIGYLADTFSYQTAWLFPIIAGFLSIPVLMLATRNPKQD